jgi:hypothetical protein
LADIEIHQAKRVFPKYIEVRNVSGLILVTHFFASTCWLIRPAHWPNIWAFIG